MYISWYIIQTVLYIINKDDESRFIPEFSKNLLHHNKESLMSYKRGQKIVNRNFFDHTLQPHGHYLTVILVLGQTYQPKNLLLCI